MKYLILSILLICNINNIAQTFTINGFISDEKGKAMPFANVALLNPKDSTFAYFAISDESGIYEIKKVSNGKYLLQTAFMGYQTVFKSIDVSKNETIGAIIMQPKPVKLNEYNIVGENIPILIKKDTLEYNASSFKTKPDASSEDLIRKLPGIEVDNTGNIKAMGEDVKRVLVDGKEFFSNDPKIATKNIPANAIKKVQLFDKKSDGSDLTGIDDGRRDKTINLILKDNFKDGIFGDIKAGYGTDNHYQASAKAYKFTKKSQFALLGMNNNINKFGFSFNDYLDFNGGLMNMAQGGKITISSDDNMPIDFGQKINGVFNNGSAGVNYSYDYNKNSRFYVSYMGSLIDKDLIQNSHSLNYTNQSEYERNSYLKNKIKSQSNSLTYGLKNKSDSTQTFILNGNTSFSFGKKNNLSTSENLSNSLLVNNLEEFYNEDKLDINTKFGTTWMKKGKGIWKLFTASANIQYGLTKDKEKQNNEFKYFTPENKITTTQLLNNKTENYNYSLTLNELIKLKNNYYLESNLNIGNTNQFLKFNYSNNNNESNNDDSINPQFTQNYQWLKPGLTLKYLSKKTKINLGFNAELGNLKNNYINDLTTSKNYNYILPNFEWEYEPSIGRRVSAYYSSDITYPNALQLAPSYYLKNPMIKYYDNKELQPEWRHDVSMNWQYFDQFSFTSLFFNINGAYTKNKINLSRNINEDLTQNAQYINVKDDYKISGSIDFSTPLNLIKLKMNTRLGERINKGVNLINNINNNYIKYNHSISLNFENKIKEKWNFRFGSVLNYSQIKYSIQKALNNEYFNTNYFAEISYNPNDKWYFELSGDYENYNSKSFSNTVEIPIISAEINYYFLKYKRGVLSLSAYDLLNKNTGVERIGDLNYLIETKSNIIQRYVMLSFKYRLNKIGGSKNSIEIKNK